MLCSAPMPICCRLLKLMLIGRLCLLPDDAVPVLCMCCACYLMVHPIDPLQPAAAPATERTEAAAHNAPPPESALGI